MAKETSMAGQDLYQSQWWTRLAAFSEKPERQGRKKLGKQIYEISSLGKTLASLLRGFVPLQGGVRWRAKIFVTVDMVSVMNRKDAKEIRKVGSVLLREPCGFLAVLGLS